MLQFSSSLHEKVNSFVVLTDKATRLCIRGISVYFEHDFSVYTNKNSISRDHSIDLLEIYL